MKGRTEGRRFLTAFYNYFSVELHFFGLVKYTNYRSQRNSNLSKNLVKLTDYRSQTNGNLSKNLVNHADYYFLKILVNHNKLRKRKAILRNQVCHLYVIFTIIISYNINPIITVIEIMLTNIACVAFNSILNNISCIPTVHILTVHILVA